MNIRQAKRELSGILLLDKSVGPSSNAVLQKVKRLYGARKVGHTGTLDPLADGMLPLCFGEATKFVRFLIDSNKAYQVTAKLGEKTTTADSTGEVIASAIIPPLSQDQITDCIQSFVGVIQQIPPMYSAIKIEGKKLYELARRGIEIERKPRTVQISSIQLDDVSLSGSNEGYLTLTVSCSKGTYIRTLVEEIGDKLGCGAHVVSLRRLWVSPFKDAPMHTMSALEAIYEQNQMSGLDALLLPPETAIAHFPQITLTESAYEALKHGQIVEHESFQNHPWVQMWTNEGAFFGMGELKDQKVIPKRLLMTQMSAFLP